MRKERVSRFAHLEYEVLHELEISIPEYWYLDMVYQLSRFGWCNKKLENIAIDMRMSKRGVMKLRDRLIDKKLIVKGVGNRVRTSEKVNKVYFSEKVYTKSEQSSKEVNKVHPKSEQSIAKTSVENNKRITKNRNDKKIDNRKEPKSDEWYASMRKKMMGRMGV